MDIYRTMTVWELLSFLKSRVKENVDQINHKISEIRKFRRESSTHPDLRIEINKSNKEISNLTDENNRLLGMFNELLKFHNSHLSDLQFNKADENIDAIKLTDEDIAKLIDDTLNGDIPIDEHHPLLVNDNTINSLLEKLLENEMYEECAVLQNLKENKHQ